MKPCTIAIPACRPFSGVCLTIESILKRTAYPNYKILVNDQSGGQGIGNKLKWLRKQRDLGNIELVETYRRFSSLDGHGAGIRELLKHCTTPYVFLFSSDIEILNPLWLDEPIRILENDPNPETVLGVAEFKDGRNHFNNEWISPRYIPCWMLLNMPVYREFQEDDDWNLSRIDFKEWPYPEIYEGMSPPAHPARNPIQVFRDTGWKLYEKLKHDDRFKHLKMLPLPDRYSVTYINHISGIDRNSFRHTSNFMVSKLELIKKRLEKLRAE